MLNTKAFNPAARKGIAKTYGTTGGAFGDTLKDDLAPNDFFSLIKDHQLQYHFVESDTGGSITDLTAALANFSFYSMYKGENDSRLRL